MSGKNQRLGKVIAGQGAGEACAQFTCTVSKPVILLQIREQTQPPCPEQSQQSSQPRQGGRGRDREVGEVTPQPPERSEPEIAENRRRLRDGALDPRQSDG